ncbi:MULTISPECIES: nucleotide exchange factor GrpE [unclassified Streptomyces]|uniref:nucleotide exchange factor GrpE n=1 Tax=unclassified Streptomyces TaxID=2593676 RepID=UPI0036ECB8CD
MSKNPHVGRDGERSPVLVRDVRGVEPFVLQGRGRPDTAVPDASGTAGTGGARPGTGRADRAAAAPRDERIAELTADLQRLKAEYDNYRKRVRRDRLAIREIAVVNVLTGLLPVLDVVEEVRHRGDDKGAAAVVSDVLEERLTALGLRTVGAPGEPFDPRTHEAITYRACGAAQETVCTEVLRHGYRVGDHLLRPAQVAVTGPTASD